MVCRCVGKLLCSSNSYEISEIRSNKLPMPDIKEFSFHLKYADFLLAEC